MESISSSFIPHNADRYSVTVVESEGQLKNYVGFIYDKLIAISCKGDFEDQRVA